MTAPAARPALHVGAGILGTRLLGLARERVFAHYFGVGMEADAFRAALRIPNIVRNLLGEGTLSASFIPTYASLLARGDRDAAARLSQTIASLLVLVAAGGSLVGYVLAPVITDAVAIGFSEETRALTIRLVRILFPMAGFMVLSAWCLGVLNSHRRFFLSYAAPALWNIAQIGALVALGGTLAGAPLVVALAWGALAGGALQFAAQLPSAVRLAGAVRFRLDLADAAPRAVVKAWLPVVFGAGVLQISSIVDTQLASLLGQGAVANLSYAQLIAILPVSLFGISIAAAALPEMSRDAASQAGDRIAERLIDGALRSLYFLLPSTAAFVVFGRHVVAPLLQTGQFGPEQTAAVAAVLLAFGIGLPARGLVRLAASGHYAMGDTRTPVRIATLTVALSALLSYGLMQRLGVSGIALGGSLAAYVNVTLNLLTLRRRVGTWDAAGRRGPAAAIVVSTLVATALAVAVDALVPADRVWIGAGAVLGTFGLAYLGLTAATGTSPWRR